MHKKVFAPALFDCLKSYSGKQFAKDAVSGVIVAIIALPLSIAGRWPAASARSRASTPPLSRAS